MEYVFNQGVSFITSKNTMLEDYNLEGNVKT